MQLSYAQNLEDYHLDLMFAGQPTGTYVDVGGGHPVADNVSFWFYLKGWRGLVVEPQQALADIYAHVRPRDRTVSCLAGRAEGEAEFHVVDKLHGFSSTVREHAAGAGQFGAGFKTIVKPVRTLAALIAEAGLDDNRLPQDRRGGRGGRRAGGHGFRALPPARDPGGGGGAGQHGGGLGRLGARSPRHGYRFAFFDRLNRFYVAEEAKELAARFPAEPAPWDSVQHLWDCGRAPGAARPSRPRAGAGAAAGLLCRAAVARPGAAAPAHRARVGRPSNAGAVCAGRLPDAARHRRVPAAAHAPAADLAALLETDQLRAALGRIACMYDGGHLLE